MAISPPSDIVLDVTRAADPLRQQVAFDRLSRMSVPGAGTQFASALDGAASSVGAGLAGAREKFAALHGTPATAPSPGQSAQRKTLEKFEAQVLSTFIEKMMPEANTNNFGDGMAGGVWRSMLSEQIAGELAKGGGIGLQKKIAAAIEARSGETPAADPSQPGTAAPPAERLLDRTSVAAGSSSRDQRIPLAIEQQFLNMTKPAHKGTVRTSIIRQA